MTGPSIKGRLPALPYRKEPKQTLGQNLLSLEKHTTDEAIHNEFQTQPFAHG